MAKRKSQSSTSTTKRNSNKSKNNEQEEEEEEELCPSCPRTKAARQQLQIDSETTDWVGCEKCNTWHHWACVTPQPAPPIETLAKWYCPTCLKTASTSSSKPLQVQWKSPADAAAATATRKSSRSATANSGSFSYANLDAGFQPDPARFNNIARSKPVLPHNFQKMQGSALTAEWLWSDPSAMTEPIIIEDAQGLDLKIPKDISVQGVADAVGHDMPVEVIDVASQSDLANWNMGVFSKYYDDPNRSKVRNVISLEISNTPLGSQVAAPRAVRDMDWIQNIWPDKLRKQGVYPQVQKYCLMSVANCWTDWHVDFAASSVWYHICKGGKTFYFIRPTAENLKQYERWSGSSDRQENTWLGDQVDAVVKVELKAGDTMIIPTGWIHAVYTPSDSLVFGGNFLHSLNIPTQLELYRIEIATKVPRKFRFPYFVKFLWFVSKHYYDRLLPLSPQPKTPLPLNQRPDPLPEERLPQDVPPRVLQGLKSLSVFLLAQARRLDKQGDPPEFTPEQRRIAKENVPSDAIKHPIEHARLFRALILRIRGEVEEAPPAPVPSSTSQASAADRKRKGSADHAARSKSFQGASKDTPPPANAASTSSSNGAPGSNTTTEIYHEVLRPPPPEGSSEQQPEELAEVRLTTTLSEVTRNVRGKERVISETRTKIEKVKRVVWSGVPPPAPSSSDQQQNMSDKAEPEPHVNGVNKTTEEQKPSPGQAEQPPQSQHADSLMQLASVDKGIIEMLAEAKSNPPKPLPTATSEDGEAAEGGTGHPAGGPAAQGEDHEMTPVPEADAKDAQDAEKAVSGVQSTLPA